MNAQQARPGGRFLFQERVEALGSAVPAEEHINFAASELSPVASAPLIECLRPESLSALAQFCQRNSLHIGALYA
jgi:hypothetical protein